MKASRLFFQKRNIFVLASFIAGFSLMTVELTASRIIAPLIGSSIFTWTAVIGVILLGLAIGSYLGGKISDKYSDKPILGLTFISASITVFIVNYLAAHTLWLINNLNSIGVLSLILVSYLFLMPAIILGGIQPIILKEYAKDFSHIGAEYGLLSSSWSLGSILGVFLTGFFLISYVGSAETIFLISLTLAILALVFCIIGKNKDLIYLSAIMILFIVTALAIQAGIKISDKNILFEKETAYYKARVVDFNYPGVGQTRGFFLDFDSHSLETKNTIPNFYTEIYPAFSVFKNDLKNILVIGGGAYTLPKNLASFYSDSSVKVWEIDPAVPKLAEKYFNLNPQKIHTTIGDARYLIKKDKATYDLIYGDAYNSFISVPGHLLTKEWNTEVKNHLSSGGIYAINFIGSLTGEKSILFKSILNTFTQTFGNYYIFSFGNSPEEIQSITILGVNDNIKRNGTDLVEILGRGMNPFLAQKLISEPQKYLDPRAIILTDDYYPTERLMLPVVTDYFPKFVSFTKNVFGN